MPHKMKKTNKKSKKRSILIGKLLKYYKPF